MEKGYAEVSYFETTPLIKFIDAPGYGRKFMFLLEDYFRFLNYNRSCVDASFPVVGFFVKLGYKTIARDPPFYFMEKSFSIHCEVQ